MIRYTGPAHDMIEYVRGALLRGSVTPDSNSVAIVARDLGIDPSSARSSLRALQGVTVGEGYSIVPDGSEDGLRVLLGMYGYDYDSWVQEAAEGIRVT